MVAPDLPGHGGAADWDAARFAVYHDQACAEVAGLLPGPKGVVLGHSFGGTVALRLAIEQPEKVGALVLIEPVLFAAAGKGAGRRAVDGVLAELGPLLRAGQRAAALRLFLSVWGAEGPDDMRLETRAYMEDRVHLIGVQNDMLEADTVGLLPRLAEVHVPVLLMSGAESPAVVPEIMAALDAGLPNARQEVVAGAGHMLPITHPKAVAERVRGFLAEL